MNVDNEDVEADTQENQAHHNDGYNDQPIQFHCIRQFAV